MDISNDITESGGMGSDSSTAKPLSMLSCSFGSKKSAVVEGLADSDLEIGSEFTPIHIKFQRIEKQLLQKKPIRAIHLLTEVLNSLNHFSECETYLLWEKLYLYFAKAYEQAKDQRSVAHCLGMAIKSVERRLSHISARSSINSANKTKELLAELCKRYATTLECLNEDTSATAVAWLKAEKAFEDCNFGRDACFSALRAVRWFMTAADLDSALSALTIALEMVKLVGKISDRGILYNELGIAFLAFELKNDSITCFRKSLKNLPEEASGARASVLQNLGSAYIAAKKLTEAIAILEQSVAAYGVMGNRAGQAQAHCNLGYAFMCMGRHKQSHWHYTLARDLAKETGWETVQTQAEAALNVLETPNFPLNIINPSPVISICPSMARLQCQVDRKIPSLSSSPSVKAKRKEKRRKRVRKGRGKQKGEQLTTILHTSDPPTKSSHSEGDIHLSTGQTSSLCKMNAIQYTIDCPSPEVIPPVGDTGISLKTPLTYLKNTASDKKLVRGVMNRKKYTRISDISSLKPPGNPNSHGDQADESLEGVMLKPVTTATLNRPRWTPFIMTSK